MLENLPAELAQKLQDAEWTLIQDGLSAAQVFHLQLPAKSSYLKYLPHGTHFDLTGERERLLWLKDKLPVPDVLHWQTTEEGQYLLMSELKGFTCSQDEMVNNPALTVQLLAEALKQIHAIDWQNCPFSRRNKDLIHHCRTNMDKGVVDETDFDDWWWGQPVEQLWQEVIETRPASEDLVLVHGDACLPNFLVLPEEKQVSGFIDVGALGVGDRYVDLALTHRSIIYNLGEKWVAPFFEAYGIAPDPTKIRWYRLVDEFF